MVHILHSVAEEPVHVRRTEELIGKKYFAIRLRFPSALRLSATTQPWKITPCFTHALHLRWSFFLSFTLFTPEHHCITILKTIPNFFSRPGLTILSVAGEISSDLDRSSLCDIERSSFKCFEIGLKMILPTQVHTQRITKTLLVHLPDL